MFIASFRLLGRWVVFSFLTLNVLLGDLACSKASSTPQPATPVQDVTTVLANY